MNYTKEQLEDLILVQKLSYEEIGRENLVTGAYIKKYAKKLGVILPIRSKFPEGWTPHNLGKAKPKVKKEKIIKSKEITIKREFRVVEEYLCRSCGKKLLDKRQRSFCNQKCQGEFKKNEKYLFYKDKVAKNEDLSTFKSLSVFKKYILEEQDNKCAVCNNPNEWNNKHLVLVLDHIDGDANNNKRTNLRCVCPNCDSQLDTFKSKNKNSGRKDRYLRNYKN